MSSLFLDQEVGSAFSLWYYKTKWGSEAYRENSGLGPNNVKNFNFVERRYYGLVDNENSAVIPNEDFLVQVGEGRIFDFVADSISLMRLNYFSAIRGNMIDASTSFMGELSLISSYENPRTRYEKYLRSILQFYNKTHIPTTIGKTSIASYEDYVKNFFNFFSKEGENIPLTLTKWQTSKHASVLETGLAFSVVDIPVDRDQRKVDEILRSDSYEYYKNLTLNMGFSISHHRPNVLVSDLSSPSTTTIRNKYGLYNLESIFNNRYIKTCILDMNILNNYINIYYNKYATENPLVRNVSLQKCFTVSTYIKPQPVIINKKMFSIEKEMEMYILIRNIEEGRPYNNKRLQKILERSLILSKRLDKPSVIGYIDREFRDQLWNKPHGFHDLKKKLSGRTKTQSQRQQTGGSPSSGDSSY